jgi:hypothetical protein
VNGDGYGFYIHDLAESNNTVRCDNRVSGAAAGFANVECRGATDSKVHRPLGS